MAIARSKLVDVSVARWNHCVSRCEATTIAAGQPAGQNSGRFQGMMQGFPLGNYVNLVEYTGRLFRQGKGLDLGGAGRDLRAAGFERPALAARDGKAPRRSFGGPLLRGQPRETAGNRRPDRRAAPGQPDRLSDPITRS
jgi:hypothetical protein